MSIVADLSGLGGRRGGKWILPFGTRAAVGRLQPRPLPEVGASTCGGGPAQGLGSKMSTSRKLRCRTDWVVRVSLAGNHKCRGCRG
jgi:hypothetical protein